MDPDTVVAGELDRAEHQHPGAAGRQLEHLLVADLGELARVGDEPWIGGEDTVDVGVDLADIGAERGGERDGGRVGAATAESRHLEGGRDALEARDEHDRVGVERLVDPVRPHLEDLRGAVPGVGDDPGLRAGQRDGAVAEVDDRHRRERTGDPLPDRDEHVELAGVGRGRDGLREGEELVGGLAHRGEDADDAVAVLVCGDEPPRDRLQAVWIGDRRATELLDDEGHARNLPGEATAAASSQAAITTAPPATASKRKWFPVATMM